MQIKLTASKIETRYQRKIGKLTEATDVQRKKHVADDIHLKKTDRAIRNSSTQNLTSITVKTNNANGETKASYATNPTEVDAAIRDAWRGIYKGNTGNLQGQAKRFMNKHQKNIYHAKKPTPPHH